MESRLHSDGSLFRKSMRRINLNWVGWAEESLVWKVLGLDTFTISCLAGLEKSFWATLAIWNWWHFDTLSDVGNTFGLVRILSYPREKLVDHLQDFLEQWWYLRWLPYSGKHCVLWNESSNNCLLNLVWWIWRVIPHIWRFCGKELKYFGLFVD